MRTPPIPPHPGIVRRPDGRFGWLEDRLLHDGWLRDVGPDAVAVLVLLALAADRHGASFFSRDRMAKDLGIDRARVDDALGRLLGEQLVALRPWRQGGQDGVWQLLRVPALAQSSRTGRCLLSAAQILRQLGFQT